MSKILEARKLNGTDIGKQVSFPETVGELRAVLHGLITGDDEQQTRRYVSVVVDKESHILSPHDHVTLKSLEQQEEAQ